MEANNNAEQTAIKLSKIIKISGIIIGAFSIIVGIGLTVVDGKDYGLFISLSGLVCILSSMITWVVINVLVNISLKLNDRSVEIHQDCLNKILKIVSKKQEKTTNISSKLQSIPDVVDNTTIETEDKQVVAEVKSTPEVKESISISDGKIVDVEEIEGEILGEILSGNTIVAKSILMAKCNMSEKRADTYIEQVKKDMN